MTEPTGAKTISDLVLEIAEFIGIAYYGSAGTEEAIVPIDEHDLEKCKKIANDAIRQFIADAPVTGWRWQKRMLAVTFVIETTGTAESGSATTLVDSGLAATYANNYFKDCIIEITAGTGIGETAIITSYTGTSGTFTFSGLSGDSTPDTTTEYAIGHRYKLPDTFGGTPDGEIAYIRGSNHGTPITWINRTSLLELRENSLTTGYPSLACINSYGRRQYELLVWPGPVAADTVLFPYTLFFDELDIKSGSATAAAATTITKGADAGRYADDYFIGWLLTVISGKGKYGTATVTGFTGSTGKIDFSDGLSNGTTPDTTSKFMLEPVNNTHPAGFQYDHAILVACKAQAEKQVDDITAKWTEDYVSLTLPKAYELNDRAAPRKLGKHTGFITRPVRTWNDVTFS